MITLHSIDLKTTDEPCFGRTRIGGCRVLTALAKECGYKCQFYKPDGCKDWIRVEDRQGVNLIPPEEYEKEIRRRHEQRTGI